MATAIDKARFVDTGQGKTLRVIGHTIRFKLTSDDTDGAFFMWEQVTPPQGGVPPHVHYREDEAFLILEGNFEFKIGEQLMNAGAGATVFLPRYVPHSFRNIGTTAGRAMGIVSPAGFEKFFEEADQLEKAGPGSSQELTEVSEKYGLQFFETEEKWLA